MTRIFTLSYFNFTVSSSKSKMTQFGIILVMFLMGRSQAKPQDQSHQFKNTSGGSNLEDLTTDLEWEVDEAAYANLTEIEKISEALAGALEDLAEVLEQEVDEKISEALNISNVRRFCIEAWTSQ